MWVYFGIFILFHWFICLSLLPILCCLDYYGFIVWVFQLHSSFSNFLTCLVLLFFHINCRINLFISAKILLWFWFELHSLYIPCLGEFTSYVLSLPAHKHDILFHFFMSSLVSFISVFQFSAYSSCTYFIDVYLIFHVSRCYCKTFWLFKFNFQLPITDI